MQHGVLMHKVEDDVGVAVVDLAPGMEMQAVTVEGQPAGSVKVVEEVPLGHKVAMRDIPKGKEVIKYGRTIGRAVQAILAGSHVHIHNLKSMRWV